MKALGIVFSARRRDNCLNSTEYVLTKLKEQGFAIEVINAYNFEIKPCSHCNYECFAKELRTKKKNARFEMMPQRFTPK